MLVLHDEYAFRGDGKIFAVLLVPGYTWLVNLEVGTQVIDLDNAQVTFLYDTAMRRCILRQDKNCQAETQEKTSDTVHNHAPILTTQRCRLKE